MAHHGHQDGYLPLDTALTSHEAGLVFEMPGESAPVRVVRVVGDKPERRPPRTTEMGANRQANPRPFYLDQEIKAPGAGAWEGDRRNEGQQANPWPYHGPASRDHALSATIYPRVKHQDPPRNLPLNGLGRGSNEPTWRESLKHTGRQDIAEPGEEAPSLYPAPLRISRRNRMSTASLPPDIKPNCSPPARDNLSAGGLRSLSFSFGPPSTSPIQGPQSRGVPYTRYRPASISYAPGTPISRSPSVVAVMGAAPHHFYTPLSSDFQPITPPKRRPTVVPGAEDTTARWNASIKGYYYSSPPPPPSMDYSSIASTRSSSQSLSPQPQDLHVNTDPSHMGYTPVSPPPAYPSPRSGGRPATAPGQKYPLYSSSPPSPSPYSPQSIYGANPDQQSPPLPGANAPPPLPLRRSNVPYGRGGFDDGPSNAADLLPRPITYYNPMPPPYLSRPQGGGDKSSSSLFSASSARRWLDKMSQALESKLESVLQGPQGPQGPVYRPAYTTGPPPQAYPIRPQTRAMPLSGYGYAPGPWGPGPAPPLAQNPPGWRGLP